MKSMKLYNTLTRQVEEFIPHDPMNVKMYTCGPTVYHYAHIGNLRTYIFEDILERTLNYIGYSVNRIMNITDVGHLSSDSDSGEDKMVKGAQREHKSVLEIAEFYAQAFLNDMDDLHIQRPETICKATDYIEMYLKIIDVLMEKGYAYQSGGNVYFDVTRLDDYYALTNHKADDMVVGVREGVEEDSCKRNQADFALWFTKSKFEDQELKWDSKYGTGYPGWHIECSGIIISNLGEYLDIHCGGVDNIFPHHTNEIAQSEAYLGHKWCNYWCHGEHLNDSTGKMSKSKGEFLTLSLLKEKGYHPLAYRLFCLESHYRKQLVFSYENLDRAQSTYDKLVRRVQALQQDATGELQMDFYQMFQERFQEALEQDLNTANALTVLYDVLKEGKLNTATKIALAKNFETVLSLGLFETKETVIDTDLEKYIQEKISERVNAKLNKDYVLADQIRQELLEQGIVLKDTREGTLYEIEKR